MTSKCRIQTFVVCKTFFEISRLCPLRQHLFDKKYSEILLQFKITVFYLNIFQNVIYSCDCKLDFQHHYCSLQCHMILQKSFEYAAQETFIIIINVEYIASGFSGFYCDVLKKNCAYLMNTIINLKTK